MFTLSGSLVSPMKGFALGTVLRSGLEDGLAESGVRAIIEGFMVVMANVMMYISGSASTLGACSMWTVACR